MTVSSVMPVPIQLPIGSEDTFKGIIDLVEMDADIYYDEMGKDMRVEEIPADMLELAQEYRDQAHRRLRRPQRRDHGAGPGGEAHPRGYDPQRPAQGLPSRTCWFP